MKERKEPRFVYCYRLSVSLDRDFGRGEVIDWSDYGMQILSTVQMDVDGEFKVRLHIERDCGLMAARELKTLEGEVVWLEEADDGKWKVGLNFKESLENLNDLLTEEDFIYIFFMPQSYDETEHVL